MKQLIEEAGVEKFTLHDLRRSVRTIMWRCGFDDTIQRLAIGQKVTGIDGLYNLDERWVVRRMAFEHAHSYVLAAIEGRRTDNVVRLAKADNPKNRLKAELLGRLREHHAGS